MREIKFRAWDKETKKMSYGNIEHFDDMLGFRFEHFETDEPIFMQYTGLKDKNGREIYEGDIVLHHTLERKFFINYNFKTLCELEDFSTNYIEVIGNIYEDRELLKE
jgi:uncharacterized phage protein (TIGR01671 family)